MPFSDNHVHNILEHPGPKNKNSIMSKRQPPSPQSQCWVIGLSMDHPKPTLLSDRTVNGPPKTNIDCGGRGFFFGPGVFQIFWTWLSERAFLQKSKRLAQSQYYDIFHVWRKIIRTLSPFRATYLSGGTQKRQFWVWNSWIFF